MSCCTKTYQLQAWCHPKYNLARESIGHKLALVRDDATTGGSPGTNLEVRLRFTLVGADTYQDFPFHYCLQTTTEP
jgi:hypothetical protein